MEESPASSRAGRGRTTIGRKTHVPAIRTEVVPRPRLDRLLLDLLATARVTVVAGAAGSGKTTAVVESLRRADVAIAWLTVDRPDAAPGRLLAYLEAALAGVAAAGGRVAEALAAGHSHAEAAGLLADTLDGIDAVLVLDDLERLDDHAEAWTVISAFLRHAPRSIRTVLISRRALPRACELPPPPAARRLEEAELAFTVGEAAMALAAGGHADCDPELAVGATGGWVTGVLFEAWRSREHVAGAGGEADPLFGYLGSQILDGLEPADRDFLIASSVLDEVDAGRAAALGLAEPAARLAALRAAHLPVAWDGGHLRCHARFREYLLALFDRRGEAERRRLHLAHGRLLVAEGNAEEAIEELSRAGAAGEAADAAAAAILAVVERLDLELARRWLASLSAARLPRPLAFAIAELMVCWAEEDYRGTERAADELASRAELEALARRSPRAAALMVWCYYMRGRPADADAIFSVAAGPELDAVGYLVADSTERPPRPELSGGPFDLFVLFADYFAGRLGGTVSAPHSHWAASVVTAWRIAVLRASGQTARALEMLETALADAKPLGMLTFLGADVYVDAGDAGRARLAVEDARSRFREVGARGWEASMSLAEARLALRLEHDPAAARRALDSIDAGTYASGWLFRSAFDVWYGFALLLEGDDETALSRLRDAVATMTAASGHLELPSAAVYLAEAEWRHGDEEEADAAADLALAAATEQGSDHLLLQALADFPAVIARRIDAEAQTDSEWHRLARRLLGNGVEVPPCSSHAVLVHDAGAARVELDGRPIRLPLSKCTELLAFLTSRPDRTASREELLEALFGGRADNSARAYLRQVIHRLRAALPAEAILVTADAVRLGDRIAFVSEATRALTALAEAARLRDGERLRATLDALATLDRGDFLAGVEASWAQARREEIAAIKIDRRLEAADLAFALGDYPLARRLGEESLAIDPYRETAWRVTIRVAAEVGDTDAAHSAYRRCAAALREVGLLPTATTVAALP